MLLMSLIDHGGVLAIVSASQWMLLLWQVLLPNLSLGHSRHCLCGSLFSIITVFMTLSHELLCYWLSGLCVVRYAVGAKLHVDNTPQAFCFFHMETEERQE
jgi:hypothetical protein